MAMTARMPIQGAHTRAASGRTGNAILTNPYVPIFSRMPARCTEPTVGASVCASGSHVWNGHMGTLMANPRNSPMNAMFWKVGSKPACCRAMMSNVCGSARKYMARKARSMNTLPNNVYRKNLMAAYSRRPG
jgi:hypothetical protein